MQTTLKELRRETGAVVRAVGRGEIVIVTCRGRPVAKMSAVQQEASTGDDELFGIWRDNGAVASVQDYMTKVRKGRVG
jgi:antitoxin (DNA-binding transcriptional repressor) of toxin-antitoxin stability system